MTEPQAHFPPSLAALQQLIMGSTLVKCAATDLGIQWAGWALAAAFKTEKFYDLAGSVAPSRTPGSASDNSRLCIRQHRALFVFLCVKSRNSDAN